MVSLVQRVVVLATDGHQRVVWAATAPILPCCGLAMQVNGVKGNLVLAADSYIVRRRATPTVSIEVIGWLLLD